MNRRIMGRQCQEKRLLPDHYITATTTLVLLACSVCLLSDTNTTAVPPRRDLSVNTDVDIRNKLVLLAFLPCRESLDGRSDMRSILEECDLLTRAGVNLAVENLNRYPLTNITVSVATLSRISDKQQSSNDVSATFIYKMNISIENNRDLQRVY